MFIMLSNLGVTAAWLILMTVGFTVDSRPWLTLIGSDAPWYSQFGGLLIGSLVYTVSNIALLSVLSAYIGSELAKNGDPETHCTIADQWRKSVARGFLVFGLTFFVGSWVDRSAILHANQEQYFALASACIFLGMTVGYDPSRIRKLLSP